MNKKAVYAGSFDPITNGHLWIIEQGAHLFDELVVAVGTNPDKGYTFTVEERVAMISELINGYSQVIVDSFADQFLVHYTHSIGAGYILRGIRNEGDYAFERAMRHVNNDLRPEIGTIFLIPPREIAEVSSSLVKGMVGPRGWEEVVKQYLPAPAYRKVLERFG